MSDQITYDDKADLIVDTTIDDIFKVSASDMNEIKNVVNSHADVIDELNAPEKWVSVGATAPTDGTRVWFEKGKNLFNKNTITNGYRLDGSGATSVSASNEFTSDFISVKPSTQYVRNYGGTSAYTRTCFYDSTKTFISKDDEHQTFTTPSNARFLRFSEYTTNLNEMQVEEGSTATAYEPYVDEGIYVDGEEWYNKSLAIKTKVYPSVTTSETGYYNLNLLCNEVAVIGMKHDPVENATKIELYSNQLGQTFIRVSVGSVYSARTITNLTIYYI